MKVLFVARPDTFSVHGGDVVQMLRTKEHLEKMGVSIDISTDMKPNYLGYDLVHIFGMHQPFQLIERTRIAKTMGVPIALSSIFWNFEELYWAQGPIREAFIKQDWSILDRLSDGTLNGGPSKKPWNAEFHKAQQLIIGMLADIVLPNGEIEAQRLRDYLGVDFKHKSVVNAVDVEQVAKYKDLESPLKDLGEDFALVAARWDDRKNLLMLLKAAEGLNIKLVFAGSRPDPGLEKLVMHYMPEGSVIMPNLSHDKLFPLMKQARVHLQPSWFETPGLSSLEAAMCGCDIVSGNLASEVEYFRDYAYYCNPGNVEEIREAIVRSWHAREQDDYAEKRSRIVKSIEEEFTWENAAKQTLEGYKEILK